ncbi:MAG: S41 family peptidase [Ardenticatenaceae bacterium]|nr:S41 family peptidase [Ardenticatenaceae bacterium]MCB8987592.1 S41 family peptidase [Ardenticatenaceae bacterium]
MNEPTKSSPVKWIVLILGALALICLVATVGAASFYFGRASASSELAADGMVETVVETVEVTRQVEVTVVQTAVPPPTPTAIQLEVTIEQPPEPTPQPDATPAETAVPLENVDNLDLDLFYEVWNIIQQQYDGQLPPKEDLLYAIVGSSVETLDDPYTRFVEPDVAARFREDMGGSVEGIGAFVRETEDGFVEIVRPIDGQPADLVGLQAGDLIIGVDGESVVGQTIDEVLLKVRGPQGSVVTLTVLRDGEEELDFTVTRTRFEIPIIESQMVTDDIGYVHLTEFNANAEEKTLEAIQDLLGQGAQSLIFDLRDNPGGFLDQSIGVADLFLADGVVLFERNNQGLEETFTAEAGDEAEDIPIVVLINAASASASEIVAGALRDNGRAALIGETTFGKGSVQQLHTLSDGSELRVTIARWYTPANVSISDAGITPDIEVVSPDDFTLGGEGDTQLQRAIEYLQNGQ